MAWNWKNLTTTEKTLLGAGAVAVGGLAYLGLRKKPEPAAATTGTTPTITTKPPEGSPPATGPIEQTYLTAPAVALDPSLMPVLRQTAGSTLGNSYWILGDESAAAIGAQLAAGIGAGNPSVGPVSSSAPGATSTYIADLGAQISTQKGYGTQGSTGYLAPADVWFVILGRNQASANIAATKESIGNIRAQLPHQRILWVLTSAAPSALAKAIGESHEEWFRSSSEDPMTVAAEAIKAADAASVADVNAAFPPPGTTAQPPPAGPAVACVAAGGTWNGTSCVMPPPVTQQPPVTEPPVTQPPAQTGACTYTTADGDSINSISAANPNLSYADIANLNPSIGAMPFDTIIPTGTVLTMPDAACAGKSFS